MPWKVRELMRFGCRRAPPRKSETTMADRDGGSGKRVRVMRVNRNRNRLNNGIDGPCQVRAYETTNETIITKPSGDRYRQRTVMSETERVIVYQQRTSIRRRERRKSHDSKTRFRALTDDDVISRNSPNRLPRHTAAAYRRHHTPSLLS